MEFRTQYAQVMRARAPKMFKRLVQSGEMEREVGRASIEAERMLRGLLKDAPKDKNWEVSMADRREAEERVRAALLDFRDNETTPEQDEMDYLFKEGPLLPPQ